MKASSASRSTTLLDSALWYANHGLPVFPVHTVRNGRCSCGDGDCQHPGKHPRTQHGFKDASTQEEQIRGWWEKWPDANIGVPTGPISGLLVLDIDPRNGGNASWEALVRKNGPLPPTAEQETGGGGRHIVLADPGVALPKELAPGIDVKGAGGYIIVAPSMHASGRRYIWDGVDGPQALLKLAPSPQWLLAEFDAARRRKKRKSASKEDKWPLGERNNRLTSIAGTMRQAGMTREAIEAALLQENLRRCDPPLPEEEVRRIAESVARYAPKQRPHGAELGGIGSSTASSSVPPSYDSRPEGMFRMTRKGEQFSEIQLTNYRASIVSSTILDDGVETKREFGIEATLDGRTFHFAVSAARFAGMEWPIDHIGPGAITFPNQREYARTAIQFSARTAIEHRTYTHTGWRKIDGQWAFLHSLGAIGSTGAVPGVEVHMQGNLGRYELKLPAELERRGYAVRASLRLAELAPPSISFPLRAATCRAVLGDADFALHVVGQTGAFKSELAALEQQHFGAAMSRLNLPATWLSTGNALELVAFHAKDVLLVIDDFAPQGNAADVSRYHAAADRVFRAAGNHAGRGRLDSTARLRESKPPRALILSTGEDIPRGHSLRARLLILELEKGVIDPASLTKCQGEAMAGVYSEAMGAFVQWLANDYEGWRTKLKKRVAELRREAVRNTTHPRTPEIISNLQAAFEIFLDFGEESGAVSAEECQRLASRCWNALCETASAQSKHQSATEPTARFVALLRGCLASGRGHLADRHGRRPEHAPESCGWRCDTNGSWFPMGECIGWADGNDIYLEPTAAYGLVQGSCRQSGDVLSVSEQILKKRLFENRLLASTDRNRQTLTVRRTMTGSRKDVLHFLRKTLLPEEPDQFDPTHPENDDAQRRDQKDGFPGQEISVSPEQPNHARPNGLKGLDADGRNGRVHERGESASETIREGGISEAPSEARPSEDPTRKPDHRPPDRERFEV